MELISAAIGILGVIIGWGLNELTTVFRGRSKLCFPMVSTPENELTEKEYHVKESPSEHGIEIFNVGENPFVLESFIICYKEKILVDCQMSESDRIILPFHQCCIYFIGTGSRCIGMALSKGALRGESSDCI